MVEHLTFNQGVEGSNPSGPTIFRCIFFVFRYKVTLEYDGTLFHGWQIQKGFCSIQGSLVEAVKSIFQNDVLVEGAGRTDKGVHATGQVAHFDLPKFISPHKIIDGLNHFLKNLGISILDAEIVDDNFHARFSAKSRIYIYKVLNRRSHSALEKNRVWHVIEKLDVNLMREGAKFLLGYHNFNSFRSSECQSKNPFRTLDRLEFDQFNQEITATIEAKSFLHNQVRIMMGTLKEVGAKKITPEFVLDILKAQNRTHAKATAPAHGLYLSNIKY